VRFLQNSVLLSKVLDHLVLLAVDPAGQDDEIELPRLQDEVHVEMPVIKGARKAEKGHNSE